MDITVTDSSLTDNGLLPDCAIEKKNCEAALKQHVLRNAFYKYISMEFNWMLCVITNKWLISKFYSVCLNEQKI